MRLMSDDVTEIEVADEPHGAPPEDEGQPESPYRNLFVPLVVVPALIVMVLVIGMPVMALAPATMLVMRAAGRPPMSTVNEPVTILPMQTGPATASPTLAAGSAWISTIGVPGAVMTSAVGVISVKRAAGNMASILRFLSPV